MRATFHFAARCVLAAALAGGFCSAASAWDIDGLMTLLAGQREGRATFVETTYIKMLDRPLESSGELMFAAPDRLEKRTLEPRLEVLALSGDQLSMERKGRKRVARMSDYPEIAVFVESIRGTLMGDRAALERAYTLALHGDEQQWQLELTPQGAGRKVVERIVIGGSGAHVASVEIAQADGDRSVMRIADTTFAAPKAAEQP